MGIFGQKKANWEFDFFWRFFLRLRLIELLQNHTVEDDVFWNITENLFRVKNCMTFFVWQAVETLNENVLVCLFETKLISFHVQNHIANHWFLVWKLSSILASWYNYLLKIVLYCVGDDKTAVAYFRKAQDFAQASGVAEEEATTQYRLACSLQQIGANTEAISLFTSYRDKCYHIGDFKGQSHSFFLVVFSFTQLTEIHSQDYEWNSNSKFRIPTYEEARTQGIFCARSKYLYFSHKLIFRSEIFYFRSW